MIIPIAKTWENIDISTNHMLIRLKFKNRQKDNLVPMLKNFPVSS